MDDRIKIETSAKSPQKKRRGWKFWVLISVVTLALVDWLCVVIPARRTYRALREEPVGIPATAPVKNVKVQPSADESQLQWASPTSGPPIDVRYLPAGTQVILHLRPQDLITHIEGEKILDSLGQWGDEVVEWLEHATGAKLAEMETLLVAVHREDDEWQFTFRAELVEPWTNEILAQRTAGAPDDRAVLLPKAGQGSMLISCPRSIGEDLVGRGDTPTLLARDLERLLPNTDKDLTATLLMPAKFLETEGQELLLDDGEKFTAAFDALLPDNAGVVAISFDWRDHFFCELAATIVQNAPAHRFTNEFTKQLAAAEQQLAVSLKSNPPHAYGKVVEERFPAMLRAMRDYTRTSHRDGIAMARCYLPIQAGHNLLLGSRLRLSAETVAPAARRTLSIAERLDQVTSLSFPKETLEKALEMLSADVHVRIQIAGRDLQLEGITKNQTLSLDLRNRPAHEILIEVLRQANPDREATGPADLRQKLVYVVQDDEIIVTTRKAATERDQKLPEVFRENQQ